MGFLLRSAALISKGNRVVDRECKTGGDAAETAGKTDKTIGEREAAVLKEAKDYRSSGFLNDEADITIVSPIL